MKVKLKSSGLVRTDFENVPSDIVTKPPKPGFVGFGITNRGILGFLRIDGRCRGSEAGSTIIILEDIEYIAFRMALGYDHFPTNRLYLKAGLIQPIRILEYIAILTIRIEILESEYSQ